MTQLGVTLLQQFQCSVKGVFLDLGVRQTNPRDIGFVLFRLLGFQGELLLFFGAGFFSFGDFFLSLRFDPLFIGFLALDLFCLASFLGRAKVFVGTIALLIGSVSLYDRFVSLCSNGYVPPTATLPLLVSST